MWLRKKKLIQNIPDKKYSSNSCVVVNNFIRYLYILEQTGCHWANTNAYNLLKNQRIQVSVIKESEYLREN